MSGTVVNIPANGGIYNVLGQYPADTTFNFTGSPGFLVTLGPPFFTGEISGFQLGDAVTAEDIPNWTSYDYEDSTQSLNFYVGSTQVGSVTFLEPYAGYYSTMAFNVDQYGPGFIGLSLATPPNLSPAGDATIYGGQTFSNGQSIQGGNIFLTGGSSALTVAGGTGNTTLFGSTGNANSDLIGGSGNNILVAGQGPSTLIGGAGTTQEFGYGAGPVQLIAATGDTTINGTTGSGAEEEFTGAGRSFLSLNAAADTVVGGSGASTVLGGEGADVYGFIKGQAGGSQTILGLKGDDQIVFGGYGGDPITSEGVLNGSDLITLNDGTVILLESLNHKVFS